MLRFPLLALILLLCTCVRAQKLSGAPPKSMGFDLQRLEGINTPPWPGGAEVSGGGICGIAGLIREFSPPDTGSYYFLPGNV